MVLVLKVLAYDPHPGQQLIATPAQLALARGSSAVFSVVIGSRRTILAPGIASACSEEFASLLPLLQDRWQKHKVRVLPSHLARRTANTPQAQNLSQLASFSCTPCLSS